MGNTVTSRSGNDGSATSAGMDLPVLPPRSALLELAVIVLAIVAIDWLLPDPGLSDAGPSPYWLPVLLMSLQYGTVSGLLAAGVSIAMTMLPGVPEQGVGENHFAYLLRIWAQPILWIAVAVVLGQFRIRQITVKRELALRVEELSSQRLALADHATNLRRRCDALERRIAGRDGPAAIDLMAAVAGLARPEHDLVEALERVVTLVMPRARLSVFLLEGPWLRRIAAAGAPEGGGGIGELTAAHPLFRAIVDRREGVTVLDRNQEPELSGQGLAAVPIRAADGEAVSGMLMLDHAGANYLQPGTIAALEGISFALAQRFCALGVARADRHEHAAPPVEETASLRQFFRKTSTWLRGSTARAVAATEPLEQADGVQDRSRAAR